MNTEHVDYSIIQVDGINYRLYCTSVLAETPTRQTSVIPTLGGEIKVMRGREARSKWDVTVPAADEETLSVLRVIENYGQVRWYSEEAMNLNMFSRQATLFEGESNPRVLGKETVVLPDGTIATAASPEEGILNVGARSDGEVEYAALPEPGERFTISVWGQGGSRITGTYRDKDGNALTNIVSSTITHEGWQINTRTFTVPADAVACNVLLTEGFAYALPTLRWGTEAPPIVGRGGAKAVMVDLEHDLTAIGLGAVTRSKVTFSMQEVG